MTELIAPASQDFVRAVGSRCRPALEPLALDWTPSNAADAVQVLSVSGELDLRTAPQLARALRMVSGTVVIDCRSLSFMGAAGIETLERALEHVDRICLINVGPRVRRVLDILGLDGDMLGERPSFGSC